ncbi:MAG TPA: hypothetical protein VGN46_03195 [Luteibacter sp.]|jgi:hypothetical protein|uniref:hypothetical protein n=1 Tax=Luteibacter sp. TaxID=1886636 RepID=UPI002F3F6247
MNESNVLRQGDCADRSAGNEPSVHALLNEATVWLQYARGLTVTLADLIHEAEGIECKHLSLSLEAVAAMMQTGTESLAQAHAKLLWDNGERR